MKKNIVIFTFLNIMSTSIYSMATIFPPTQYICTPDKIGTCWCEQDESDYFPRKIRGSFTCSEKLNHIKRFHLVQVDPYLEPTKAIAQYGIFSIESIMNVYSNVNVSHGGDKNWQKAPAAPWSCAGKSCDLIKM